jgi:adenosylcobinamide-phosphate synthase
VTAVSVLLAGLLDARLREPPAAVHPVRLMGRFLDRVARYVPAKPPRRAMTAGALAWTAGAAATALVSSAASSTPQIKLREQTLANTVGAHFDLRSRGAWPRTAADAVALWGLFSRQMLLDEVTAVEAALGESVDAGRSAVARLVSRDTSGLSESQVRQAAIESLAENLSDSVVAPLLWYAVGGLPAAATYRFANTADAMWGYRDTRWEHAGRVAARVDDVLNLGPSRLTGLALAGPHVPSSELNREARRTPSPNAGWPMAALALRLGIRLEKPGVYTLNPAGRLPTPDDARTAVRLTSRVGWAAVLAAAALSEIRLSLKGRP